MRLRITACAKPVLKTRWRHNGWMEMKTLVLALALLFLALVVSMTSPLVRTIHAQALPEIGGQKVVILTRAAVSTTRPEFTSITVAPGRGMEILQITANFPGKGNVDVLASPDLAGAKKMLDVDDDEFGNLGYRLGAALLAPYPNRIRGTLSADTKTLTTEWHGHTITLPANNGRQPGGDIHAMHGLILKAKTDMVSVKTVKGGEEVSGIIHAGDFGGHWLSKTQLMITIRLAANAVDVIIEAGNVGNEAEPMAIAWHPYFNLPSGDRTQARVQIPGTTVAELDNYKNVYPTGKLLPVEGTKFDMNYISGTTLGTNYYDDNWSHLVWGADKAVTVRVIDLAAHYGISIEGLSPEIKTIQMYAPPTKNFVAIEHQYNFADPFGKEWSEMDTGMVTLKPGQRTTWHVRLRLFTP
jgi:galactose mutarotase-like enzyme